MQEHCVATLLGLAQPTMLTARQGTMFYGCQPMGPLSPVGAPPHTHTANTTIK